MTSARALRLLVMLSAVAIMAGAMTWAAGPERLGLTAVQSAGVALVWASLLGVPVVMWTLDRDRQRPGVYLLLSTASGVLLPVLALSSGLLGLFMRWGVSDLEFALRQGAPLPWYGPVGWPAFLHMAWQAALVGAMSGAIGWFVVVGPRRPGVIVGLLLVAIVAIAMGAAALTHQGP